MPKRPIAAIDQRAVSLGLGGPAYLVSLARADSIGTGIEPPAPPPPKRNGRDHGDAGASLYRE